MNNNDESNNYVNEFINNYDNMVCEVRDNEVSCHPKQNSVIFSPMLYQIILISFLPFISLKDNKQIKEEICNIISNENRCFSRK